MDKPISEAGVEKKWLETLVKSEIEAPKEWKGEDVKEMVAAKPSSKMQELIQGFFWRLKEDTKKSAKFTTSGEITEQPDEDMFADWYEEHRIADYTHSYKLFQFFNTLARALHTDEVTGTGTREEFQKLIGKITMKCIEEEEHIETIREVIDEKYPGLAGEFRSEPSIAELNEREAQRYSKEVSEISTNIESNVNKYEKYLAKIKTATKTDFEKTAQDLNRIVIFGEPRWELILYCLMSPHAPRVYINRPLTQRSNLHVLLAGDISTAKSKILKIAKTIAPKMVVVDESTKASFEGVAPTKNGGEIEDGIIDDAQNGVIITEELTSDFIRTLGGMFRRVMDCEPITIHKKGADKVMDVNTTMLAACNPVDDFFVEDDESGNFRKQIKFKEGILSRFDILIPMMATQISNEILLPKIHLMSSTETTNPIDLEAIHDALITISQGMGSVTESRLSLEQEDRIKSAFSGRNQMDQDRHILKNRPLVIFRDLETLTRLANTIGAVNFAKRRVENGILYVDDSDVDKAIQLWENLIQLRVQLYSQHDRNMRSVGDEILLYVHRAQGANGTESVEIDSVYHEIVENRRIVGKTTFYKEINTLEETGRLAVEGKRDKRLRVIVK